MSDHIIPESPPLRSTILSSFLRGRPRGASHSNSDTRETSPNTHQPQPPPPSTQQQQQQQPIHHPPSPGHRRRNAASPNPSTTTPLASSVPTGLGLSHMLRRRRSAGNIPTALPISTSPSTAMPPQQEESDVPSPATAAPPPAHQSINNNVSHRIRFVPHIESRRSLRFDPITRTVKPGDPPLRIGRFTDRSGAQNALSAVAASQGKLAFKSKVVSRAHAEIWVDADGRFFIKDTKSSSGTFLNHVRLSNAGVESRQQQIKDGDILQLGVDYQGGTEDIYKSVKMRVEIGRDWQRSANAFNTAAFKNLKSLAAPVQTSKSEGGVPGKVTRSTSIPDCCICLFPVSIRQALFLAPCSHTFHYKCIRPILVEQHPAFVCPLCRTFADLEEDVEIDDSSMLIANGIDEEEEEEGAEAEAKALAAVAQHIQQHEDQANSEGPAAAAAVPVPVAIAAAAAASGLPNNRGAVAEGVPAGAETEVEEVHGLAQTRPRRVNGRVFGVPSASGDAVVEHSSEDEEAMDYEVDALVVPDQDSQEDHEPVAQGSRQAGVVAMVVDESEEDKRKP